MALGSRDSGHAAILPLHYLEEQGLTREIRGKVIRFDTDIGKHGDTGDSELRVVRAVAEGQADAGALGDATWPRSATEGLPAAAELEVSWRSSDLLPLQLHCAALASTWSSRLAGRGRCWR